MLSASILSSVAPIFISKAPSTLVSHCIHVSLNHIHLIHLLEIVVIFLLLFFYIIYTIIRRYTQHPRAHSKIRNLPHIRLIRLKIPFLISFKCKTIDFFLYIWTTGRVNYADTTTLMLLLCRIKCISSNSLHNSIAERKHSESDESFVSIYKTSLRYEILMGFDYWLL